MQRYGAVAAVDCLEVLDIVARGGVGGVVPSVGVASGVGDVIGHCREDSEVQGDSGVGAVYVMELLDVVTGLRVNGVVPLIGDTGGIAELVGG